MQLQLLHSGKMTFFSSENSVSRSQVKKEADPMCPMCRRFTGSKRIAKPSIPILYMILKHSDLDMNVLQL